VVAVAAAQILLSDLSNLKFLRWTKAGLVGNKKRRKFRACCTVYLSITKRDKKFGKNFNENFKSIIFPDQSPNQILNGYAKGAMPDEYTGGVGKEGVENCGNLSKRAARWFFSTALQTSPSNNSICPSKTSRKD
jgi:hypothetical protein